MLLKRGKIVFKKNLLKILLAIVLIAGMCIVFTSCGAILYDLIEGRGNKGETIYTLTINFDYQGYKPVDIYSPIRFWIMPLDQNGEPMQDPENPGGPPLRKQIKAYSPYGNISIDLESGEYAVLAFVDYNDNGDLDLLESYVIYDGHSMAEEWLDKIFLFNDESIYIGFDDLFEWHIVYIRYPFEGDTIGSDFWADGIFITDEIKRIEIWIDDSIYQGDATIYYNEDRWEVYVDVSSLFADAHFLCARAFDEFNPIDEYVVSFNLY